MCWWEGVVMCWWKVVVMCWWEGGSHVLVEGGGVAHLIKDEIFWLVC